MCAMPRSTVAHTRANGNRRNSVKDLFDASNSQSPGKDMLPVMAAPRKWREALRSVPSG
jgi:hypothetical protein